MKILVTGGRAFEDYDGLSEALDQYKIDIIVHGGAKGADSLAERYCQENGIKSVVYEAEWDVHGRAAGPIRNQKMLESERPDLIIACPGGAGTHNCISGAMRLGLPIEYLGKPAESNNLNNKNNLNNPNK